MNDKYLESIDNTLDSIKHSPCTFDNCGRKSVMRIVMHDFFVSACVDHVDKLIGITKPMIEGKDIHIRIPK